MQTQANATSENKAAITVGSNDTVNVAPAKSASPVRSVDRKRIQQLIADREAWEQGVARTCNAQLYELLANCFTLYLDMCGKSDNATALQKALAKVIDSKHYRFTQNTHMLTKIVKCVFGVDRRRVSAYSVVLREALSQNLTAAAIPSFIANAGGIEEIRRSKNADAKTPVQKAELGNQAVRSKKLDVINSSKIAEIVDTKNAGKYLIAIVTQQADSSLVVHALVNSQSVLNAALVSAYTASKSVVQIDSSNAASANDDQFRETLINSAASN